MNEFIRRDFGKMLNSTLRNDKPISYFEFYNFLLMEGSLYDIVDSLPILEKMNNVKIKNIVKLVSENIDEISADTPEEKIQLYRDGICDKTEMCTKILMMIRNGEKVDYVKNTVNVLLDDTRDFRMLCKFIRKLISCVIDHGYDSSVIGEVLIVLRRVIESFSPVMVNELYDIYNSFPTEAQEMYLKELYAIIMEYKEKYDMINIDDTIIPRQLAKGNKVVLKKSFPEVKIRQPYYIEYENTTLETYATMNPVVGLAEEGDIIECENEDDINEINFLSDYYIENIINKCIAKESTGKSLTLLAVLVENYLFDVEEAGAGKKIARKIADGSDKALQKTKQKMNTPDSPVKIIGRSLKSWENLASDTINKMRKMNSKERRERAITGNYMVKLKKIIRDAILVIGAGAVGASFGPVVAMASGAITLMTIMGTDKHFDKKAKNAVIKDLELELKMVKEKIEDAKSNNDTKAKYALMRLENKLQRNINVIKNGIRDDYEEIDKEEVKKNG